MQQTQAPRNPQAPHIPTADNLMKISSTQPEIWMEANLQFTPTTERDAVRENLEDMHQRVSKVLEDNPFVTR